MSAAKVFYQHKGELPHQKALYRRAGHGMVPVYFFIGGLAGMSASAGSKLAGLPLVIRIQFSPPSVSRRIQIRPSPAATRTRMVAAYCRYQAGLVSAKSSQWLGWLREVFAAAG